MNYELVTREIEDRDIGIECPFEPEEGEYETYLNSLFQCISELDIVKNTSLKGKIISIEICKNDNFENLRQLVKPLIQGTTYTKLRVVSFR